MKRTRESLEAIRVIDDLGGPTAVARLFGIKPPSVSEWKREGIPKARRQYLELLRPDIFLPAPGSSGASVPAPRKEAA